MRTALRLHPASAASLRSGLAIGGLYGWILTFPKFGPLLFHVAGERAPALGLLYIVAQGASMALLAILPERLALRPSLTRGAGALLTLATLLFAVAPQSSVHLGLPLLATMAILAAHLVLAWSTTLDRLQEPVTTLVVALASAELLVAAVSAAQGLFPGLDAIGLTLIAGLAMASSSAIAAGLEAEGPATGRSGPVRLGAASVRPFLPGIAFAVGAFLVSGVWYDILGATPAPEWQWRPVAEALTYALGILLFGDQARRDRPGMMALYSLSLLGLGLLAAIGSEGEWATFFRSLFQFGLAGANLYYWYYLWRVRSVLGTRKTMGWGLGLSLGLTALANLAGSAIPLPGQPGMAVLLAGAAVLFLIIPIGSREPELPEAAPETPPEPLPETAPAMAEPAPVNSLPIRPLDPPTALTQAERQVYDLLVRGASDAEIALQLYISRHTVKFHVRNILRKVGVENRKELLSRLVSLQNGEMVGDLAPPE